MTLQEMIQAQNAKREEGKALMKTGDKTGAEAKKKEIDELQVEIDAEMMFMANEQIHGAQAFLQGFEASRGIPFANFGEALKNDDEDPKNSMKYRQAFMKFVLTGKKDKEAFNEAGATTTADLGVAIPTVVINQIVSKLTTVGNVFALVNRTSYKGGVAIPKSNFKPVATWVGEGEGSEKQKYDVKDKVSFTYHKLRCVVARTLEVSEMAISAFEAKMVADITEAMIKAIENGIINGTGSGQPKGILKIDAPDDQTVEMSTFNYATLVDAEAALPSEYEVGAVWTMAKKTFYGFVGMVDANGQPIARVDHGINGQVERTLLGRKVLIVDYVKTFDKAIVGEAFAFLFNYADYTVNTNFTMGIKHYEDNDTDDLVTKAIMLVDGQVVDENSLVKVVKKLVS